MEQQGYLLLTAAGFYNPKILQFVLDRVSKEEAQVALVTTAAENKEHNKYSQLAKSQFEEAGFKHVDFVDLEVTPHFSFTPYTIIYVCGGNTFTLMKYAREAHFGEAVTELCKRNGIYIGVSAGSVIAGPSIQIAAELAPDINEVGLSDMTGMLLTDAVIYPHYEEKDEVSVNAFENKYSVSVTRLTNSQALLVSGNEKQILE